MSQYSWYMHGGYVSRKPSRTKPWITLHRFILGLGAGRDRSKLVDHVDGDRLNNTRANLRICNNTENVRNCRRRSDSRMPFKGIDQRRGRVAPEWRARIRVNGATVRSAWFTRPELAAAAYDELAIKHHGAFARTNARLGLLPTVSS